MKSMLSRARTQKVFALTALSALLCSTAPLYGAFHLWTIKQIYSDSSGSLQFIELFTAASGQTFTGGQQINVSDGTTTHTFTIPGNLSSDSANHDWLFGTAGIHAAGAPTPDYVLPNNFLFTGGGTISFFGSNSGSYTALPTDGSNARNWADGNAVNSPQNFAGQTGMISVPEPASFSLLAAGLLLLLLRRK